MSRTLGILVVVLIAVSYSSGEQPTCQTEGRFDCLFDVLPYEKRTQQKCELDAPFCTYCSEKGGQRRCQIHNRACIVPDHVEVAGNLNQEQCEGQGFVYCWGDVSKKCVYPEPARAVCFKKNLPTPCSDVSAITENACHTAGCVWCGEGSRSTTINKCWALQSKAVCPSGGNCCTNLRCSSDLAQCESKGCRLCINDGVTICVYRTQFVHPTPPPTGLPICLTGNAEDCFADLSVFPSVELCEELSCNWCLLNGMVPVCRRENFPASCLAPINTKCPTENLDTCPTCKSYGCEWCGGMADVLECQASTTCTTCNCPDAVECPALSEVACGAKGCLWCDNTTATRNFHCMNLDSEGILPTNPNMFTECSRTCGSGTRWRYTDCERANPLSCPREYATCNTQPCSIDICTEGELVRANLRGTCCMNHTSICGRNSLNDAGPPTPGSGRKRRVVGGSDSGDGEKWPWLVLLQFGNSDNCTGTVVSDEFIITAACCVEGRLPAEITINLDAYNLQNPPGLVRSAIQVVTNEDVALIQMNATVAPYSNFVHPLCMPNGETPAVDEKCFIAGWGLTDIADPFTFPTTVHDVEVRISSWAMCEEAWAGSVTGLDPQIHFCAGIPEGAKDACTGDKGSPLMCQRSADCGFYLAGVATGDVGCGLPAKPTLYAKVLSYEAWASGVFTP